LSGNRMGEEQLLNGGATPDVVSTRGSTPLKVAVMSNQRDMVTLLLKAGADPDFDGGFPPSPRAISQSKDASIQLLLAAVPKH
jgi:ankyrin repeat protein